MLHRLISLSLLLHRTKFFPDPKPPATMYFGVHNVSEVEGAEPIKQFYTDRAELMKVSPCLKRLTQTEGRKILQGYILWITIILPLRRTCDWIIELVKSTFEVFVSGSEGVQGGALQSICLRGGGCRVCHRPASQYST